MWVRLRILNDTCLGSASDLFCCLKRSIKWFCWEFLGIRAIWERDCPPDPTEPKCRPSTFMLWLIGLYVALFGIASARYEYSLDRIENRVQMIVALNAVETNKATIAQIPGIQNSNCPIKPDVLSPYSVLKSLAGKTTVNRDAIDSLKALIEARSSDLMGVDLAMVNLEGADLRRADFRGADLRYSNFKNAKLKNTNFEGANLVNANLSGSNLEKAILRKTSLTLTNFQDANLLEADFQEAYVNVPFHPNKLNTFKTKSGKPLITTNFKGANLSRANLLDVPSLQYEQLLQVASLYEARIDSKLRIIIEKIKSYLLRPKSMIDYEDKHYPNYIDDFNLRN